MLQLLPFVLLHQLSLSTEFSCCILLRALNTAFPTLSHLSWCLSSFALPYAEQQNNSGSTKKKLNNNGYKQIPHLLLLSTSPASIRTSGCSSTAVPDPRADGTRE